jgi:hypothetical protein
MMLVVRVCWGLLGGASEGLYVPGLITQFLLCPFLYDVERFLRSCLLIGFPRSWNAFLLRFMFTVAVRAEG